MTSSEAETKRQKAVDFLRRIGNDDDADRFESMDAAEYAEHRGATFRENPTRRDRSMPRIKSRDQLKAELDEANEYIEELETKLDSIAGIASGEEDDDQEEGSDPDDEE